MYIVFMLLTPLPLRIAKRWGWGAVLALSGSIWLLAQFNLRGWIYAVAAHFGFPIPLNERGAFDLFGWQFLWTVGLHLGSSKAASLFSEFRIPKWVVMSFAAIVAVLFVCRHTAFDVLIGPTLFDVLANKWIAISRNLVGPPASDARASIFGSVLHASGLLLLLSRAGYRNRCAIYLAARCHHRGGHFYWVVRRGVFYATTPATAQRKGVPGRRSYRRSQDSKDKSQQGSERSPA